MITLKRCLTILIATSLIIFSTGCANKEPVIIEKIVEVPKPYKVPVKCKVEKPICVVEGSMEQKLGGLIACIKNYREAIKVCE